MFKALAIYKRPNLLKICLFGFINGIGLSLSSNTLNFWLSSYGIDNKVIGLFSCIALPYALKYIIAFFISKYQFKIPILYSGKYKGWLSLSQIMLVISLIIMSFLTPKNNLPLIAVLGLFLALFAVIQYIILNGNRINILSSEEQGPGSAIDNLGYRLGMLITGAGVIFISAYISWSSIYKILSVIFACLTIIVNLCYKEPSHDKNKQWWEEGKKLQYNLLLTPIQHFLGYKSFIIIILFTLLHPAADGMLMAMLNPFLLHQGYNAIEIASASKTIGILMVIVGGLTGGVLIEKIGIKNSLLSFAILHLLGHALFIGLSIASKNMLYLYFVTGYVAFTGGMNTNAYFAFISNISSGKHAAILYSLLSSVEGLSWVLFPSFSGIIADCYGWTNFFIIITLTSFMIALFTWCMPKKIYQLYQTYN